MKKIFEYLLVVAGGWLILFGIAALATYLPPIPFEIPESVKVLMGIVGYSGMMAFIYYLVRS